MCHTWLSFLKLHLQENDTGVRMMSQHEKSREAFPVIIHLSTTSHPLAEIWTRWPNMSPLPLPSVILWVMGKYRRSTVGLLAVAKRQGTKNAYTSQMWIYDCMWQLPVEITLKHSEITYFPPSAAPPGKFVFNYWSWYLLINQIISFHCVP